MIVFNNVSLKKGDLDVLTDLNLTILSGKYGLVGANGSGKSTFLDGIAGKLFPIKGKIEKPHYRDIKLVPRDYSFDKIVGPAYQYYQQRYQAYDSEVGPTVWEVFQNQQKPVGTVDEKSVDLPPLAYEETWVQDIAKQMNILHLLNRKVTTLSNGETRRSLLAYTLLQKPRVLLLDNPYVGLDTKSKELLSDLITSIEVPLLIIAAPVAEIPGEIKQLITVKDGTAAVISREYYQQKAEATPKETIAIAKLKTIIGESNWNYDIALRIENGSVVYGQKAVLSDINWTVKKGEKWALLGPNGSGKSTLLSLFTADNPQAYQNKLWLFDKRRGTGESIWDIKRRIGYVSPELHLFFPKNSTVYKSVASGLFDTMGLFKHLSTEEKELVQNMLELFQLDNLAERTLSNISTGQQRMVFLARAIIKNPTLLILDEACQGLDTQHMVAFRDLVNDIATTLGTTLIYVTHNLEELPACINQTLHLDNGKMV